MTEDFRGWPSPFKKSGGIVSRGIHNALVVGLALWLAAALFLPPWVRVAMAVLLLFGLVVGFAFLVKLAHALGKKALGRRP